MKYNLSKIMLKAWKVYRKTKSISFAEALHRAWLSAKAEEINDSLLEFFYRFIARVLKNRGY